MKSSDVALLSADPDVEYIGPDHQLKASATTFSPDYGWMTALRATSPSATLSWDGTGIGVAVIDSGVNATNDLQNSSGKNRIVYSQSFVPNDTHTTDLYGHGTMVTGVIGGNGHQSDTKTNTYTIRGIAPNVNIVNLRVLNNNGSATTVR
jgi:serine protease AprX